MFGVDIVAGDQRDFKNCDTEYMQERDFTDVILFSLDSTQVVAVISPLCGASCLVCIVKTLK